MGTSNVHQQLFGIRESGSFFARKSKIDNRQSEMIFKTGFVHRASGIVVRGSGIGIRDLFSLANRKSMILNRICSLGRNSCIGHGASGIAEGRESEVGIRSAHNKRAAASG